MNKAIEILENELKNHKFLFEQTKEEVKKFHKRKIKELEKRLKALKEGK